MESFFSLFDPSEGQSQGSKKKKQHSSLDNVKKKGDAPKGRRRGRKCQGKNETLPEESSFLCEPELGTEVLVKSESYIENFFEATKKDTKSEGKKNVKRNSRKNRRKKNKISPTKDNANQAWQDLNNKSQIEKEKIIKVGQNVNKLHENDKGNDNYLPVDNIYNGNQINNVFSKLENVNYNDEYIIEDINLDDLEISSNSEDEQDIDSLTEASLESTFCLPPEPRFGNVEYKLHLINVSPARFQHLVSQMKWRLASGGGHTTYVLGVRDCGRAVGLRSRALLLSLRTAARCAAALGAALAAVTVRGVRRGRSVAEIRLRRLAETQQSVEIRVAVVGANEAGKSTLIGVLTQGELDNGRGSARLNMFRHVHEVRSGRTSSLSHEILGFDTQGRVVNYGCAELMTAARIGERSARLVSFLDLCGHARYQRTTVRGLAGYTPHYTVVLISATAGIKDVTEEHLDLLLALNLKFFIVVNKCELVPNEEVVAIVERISEFLRGTNKKPLIITNESSARNCNAIDEDDDDVPQQVPVFPVSCVKGTGLNFLHAYLLTLQPPKNDDYDSLEKESMEFEIDEIFHVGLSTGPVVGGLLTKGVLNENQPVLIGPLDTGEFVETTVMSIYRNRVPSSVVKAGQCASLGLSSTPPNLRQGMVILEIPKNRKNKRPIEETKRNNKNECQKCDNNNDFREKDKLISKSAIIDIKSALTGFNIGKTDETAFLNTQYDGMKKEKRKKEKNLLKEFENSLMKSYQGFEVNMYKSDSDENGEYFPYNVFDEDPTEPRGCMYFEADVHLLSHSTQFIYPGFQCTVHIGNVRQTAIVVAGTLSLNKSSRSLFRWARVPERCVVGRTLLLRSSRTRATGRLRRVYCCV